MKRINRARPGMPESPPPMARQRKAVVHGVSRLRRHPSVGAAGQVACGENARGRIWVEDRERVNCKRCRATFAREDLQLDATQDAAAPAPPPAPDLADKRAAIASRLAALSGPELDAIDHVIRAYEGRKGLRR